MTKQTNDTQPEGDEPLVAEAAEDFSDLPLDQQITAIRERLEEALRETEQKLDAAQRAQAELVNYRRRSDEERIEQSKYANTRLMAKLLPVMEELDLAVTHCGEGGPNESWLDGIKLIQRKLANLLQSEGVSEIETVGTEFNPVEHEALGTVETSEYPPGWVTEAVRPGYRLHDRIIQPAQVMVAREPHGSERTTEKKEIENG